ncbi:MAG TPA: response regulator [Terriglobia bacterium]|nr:response regulator [Terriglobia bacterium]
MTNPVQILLLEDNPLDAELIQAALDTLLHTPRVVRVETGRDFREALNQDIDLIISDYSLPSFDGKKALAMAKELRPDIPFILVSGTVGEEAIDSLLAGATDYVLKHKFARFVPAVQRALQEAGERKARREAEEALKKSEEKYRQLFEEARDTLFIVSSDGNLIDINPAGLKMFGYSSKEEILRTNIGRDIYKSPRRWKEVRSLLEAQGYVEDLEVELKRRDGARLIALETTTVVSSEGGKVRMFHGTWRDVTKHRELEAQFLRSQRMESLGSLAGGIAHDLNNVLSPIVMGVEILKEKHTDPDTMRYLVMLDTCAKRGANLLRQILMFARGVEGRRTPLSLSPVFEAAEKMIRHTFSKSIEIITNIAPDLWRVSADKTQIEQVLMNLCVNARDAMPDGGTITVSVCNEMDEKSGPYVVIEVTDTGRGIPPENLPKIFDPFFTTKQTGTGLGLSTVSAIVRNHGGFIDVNSVLEQGTTFTIHLPALRRGSEEAPAAPGPGDFPPGNGELILVVDDEAAVRDLVRTILSNYGYRVAVAADGIEGVAVYSKLRDEIKLVLTDLDMPRMNGAELIRKLERINPDVRVVSVSGLISSDSFGQTVAGPVHAVLQKPFSAPDLLRTLHDILQRH